MKKIAIFLLIVVIIIGLFYSISSSQTINVNDYIKDKFPSIFSFYLSSLEKLDSYEKEFIDLLQKLPKDKQEYYAKEVYKNSFSLELLKNVKEGKTIQAPTSKPTLPSLPKQKEESTESLPSLIKRIKPSVVIVFVYDNKGEFLQLGSGFFISQSGDIITNYHVLQGANSAEVKTSDGKTYPITHIVAFDEQNDIIRLSVDIPSKYVLTLSLSKTTPEIGERIIVYGSPLGLEKTVSDGIVSAIREVPGYGKLIQITAPISPGSSGSPVLNMKGEVIGIATFQFIEGQNLNFAIPSERIASLNLMEEEKTFTTEELFEQEDKDKKIYDYSEAYNKALYFIEKEEYNKAFPYLEIASKTDILSLKARAYFAIGYCYENLEFYVKAIDAYEQAIRLDPNNPNNNSAYYSLGRDYALLGLYKDATEAFKQAIRIDPEYVDAYNLLGVTYVQLDLYKDAIETYKQAIRIDPNDADSHIGLGFSYFLIGDKSSALDEYKILKELDIDKANELFDLIY